MIPQPNRFRYKTRKKQGKSGNMRSKNTEHSPTPVMGWEEKDTPMGYPTTKVM